MTDPTDPMRRRPRRRGLTAATACGVALCVLLTGCGALTPGSSADTDRPTAVPSATEVPDRDITLKLQFADAPLMVDALIAAFEKKHPRVTIEPQYTQFSDYVKSLKLTMASETAPDIAQFAVGMDDLAGRGDILDLAPYRESYGWDEQFPAANLEQLAAGGGKPGAKPLYGVPVGLSMTGVYYNKQLAAKAGISRPPATLAEFERQLAAVKKAGMTPLGVGALDSGGLHLWAALVNVLMSAEEYRSWVAGEDGATIETRAARAASELLSKWSRKGYIDESANGTGQVDSTTRFTRGNSVFLINGNWAAGQLADTMGDRAGFFLMPGAKKSARAMASGFSVAYAISSRTENPEAAGAFLDFLSSPEAARIVQENGFLVPDPDEVPAPEGLLAEVARSHRRVVADDGINHFPDFAAPAMLDPLRSGVQKLIAHRGTPSEYLDSLQDVWDEHHAK